MAPARSASRRGCRARSSSCSSIAAAMSCTGTASSSAAGGSPSRRAAAESRRRRLRRRGLRAAEDFGEGRAFVELGGEIVKYELAAGPGDRRPSRPYRPVRRGRAVREMTTLSGVHNTFFATGDMFMARLTGPGRVWLQTLTLPGLAHAISHYLPKQGWADASPPCRGGVRRFPSYGGRLRCRPAGLFGLPGRCRSCAT